MSDLLELTVYPIKKAAALLFSLTFDGVSIGALILSAAALAVIYRFLVGRLVGGYLIDPQEVKRLGWKIRAKRSEDSRLKED